ncbi:MAG: type II secretion system F family protein [Aeromicrobium sp.]|uniref:type II secretion system F family protein n=1 Tax=Aeromicrobium sp. TaxID=1871063 RepID=UPI0039E4ED67
MSPEMWGAVAAGGAVGGVALAVDGWRRSRRPVLMDRVAPYVGDVARGPVADPGARGLADRLRSVGGALAEAIGSADSVRRRLDRLGSDLAVEAFRVRQLRSAAVGFGVAVAFSLAMLARRPASPLALMVLCAIAALGAAWWCDQDLTRRVERREQAMAQEFPTVADLLALAVAAGESPASAVRRVAGVAHGDLADELRRVMGDVHAGDTIATAFDALAARTGVASVARFAEALAGAVERGTPLVDVLHAQAADVRESARRSLIESGARREVLMMVPVVFAILPVTVIFAFYPGVIGLQLTTGS